MLKTEWNYYLEMTRIVVGTPMTIGSARLTLVDLGAAGDTEPIVPTLQCCWLAENLMMWPQRW